MFKQLDSYVFFIQKIRINGSDLPVPESRRQISVNLKPLNFEPLNL